MYVYHFPKKLIKDACVPFFFFPVLLLPVLVAGVLLPAIGGGRVGFSSSLASVETSSQCFSVTITNNNLMVMWGGTNPLIHLPLQTS